MFKNFAMKSNAPVEIVKVKNDSMSIFSDYSTCKAYDFMKCFFIFKLIEFECLFSHNISKRESKIWRNKMKMNELLKEVFHEFLEKKTQKDINTLT